MTEFSALPKAAAAVIDQAAPGFVPRAGVVLGSGLGELADDVEARAVISYGDLPGFPTPGVSGHSGRLILGALGGVDVAVLQGRAHAYEGRGADVMAVAVRTMKLIGAELLYLTCAAGSLRRQVGAGQVMMITDHINLQGTNPLVGPNDEAVGPRFPPLTDAYDPKFCVIQRAAARATGIDLAEGVYAAWLGPSFETAAEVRMTGILGADAVGMSTVPECILARHCGLRVTATAAITNLGVGLSDEPVSHEQTLRAGAEAGKLLRRLIPAFLQRMP